MNNNLLSSKKVLSICMETTAGGRNYSGGLGALYGDTTRTMYRLGADFIAVTPIYKNGYVWQTVGENGVVDEYPPQDFIDDYDPTNIFLEIPMLGTTIKAKVWQNRRCKNSYGIETDLPANGLFAEITNNLYGENGIGEFNGEEQRLMQEIVVGVGAIELARSLNYDFNILHLNEGHGVFAAVYLVAKFKEQGMSFEEAVKAVRRITVFTTHTPISAGNKSRPINMIMKIQASFGLSYDELNRIGGDDVGVNFGSTTAALRLSKIANAVALRHQSTSREIWQHVTGACPITYIDNGVDILFWQDPRIKRAYETFDYEKLLEVHNELKMKLVDEIEKRNGVRLNPNAIIVGFARRVIEYKRADLIFKDISRFEKMIREHGFQIVFSGKTHPKDLASKGILTRLYEMTKRYPNNVVFLQNYDVEIARLMTQGCDVWLGNPRIPLEACSTSGMKAAANGVVNVSTEDGWWYRSARYNVNGWIIGESKSQDDYTDSMHLYKCFEDRVFPVFEYNKPAWAHMMFASIYTAEEECSTERMCRDYYAYIYNAPEIC